MVAVLLRVMVLRYKVTVFSPPPKKTPPPLLSCVTSTPIREPSISLPLSSVFLSSLTKTLGYFFLSFCLRRVSKCYSGTLEPFPVLFDQVEQQVNPRSQGHRAAHILECWGPPGPLHKVSGPLKPYPSIHGTPYCMILIKYRPSVWCPKTIFQSKFKDLSSLILSSTSIASLCITNE